MVAVVKQRAVERSLMRAVVMTAVGGPEVLELAAPASSLSVRTKVAV
jgi:hypothetical protein